MKAVYSGCLCSLLFIGCRQGEKKVYLDGAAFGMKTDLRFEIFPLGDVMRSVRDLMNRRLHSVAISLVSSSFKWVCKYSICQ